MKARRKPIVEDAIQYMGAENCAAVHEFLGVPHPRGCSCGGTLSVRGVSLTPGNWISREADTDGPYRSTPPDTFEATYEPVATSRVVLEGTVTGCATKAQKDSAKRVDVVRVQWAHNEPLMERVVHMNGCNVRVTLEEIQGDIESQKPSSESPGEDDDLFEVDGDDDKDAGDDDKDA